MSNAVPGCVEQMPNWHAVREDRLQRWGVDKKNQDSRYSDDRPEPGRRAEITLWVRYLLPGFEMA